MKSEKRMIPTVSHTVLKVIGRWSDIVGPISHGYPPKTNYVKATIKVVVVDVANASFPKHVFVPGLAEALTSMISDQQVHPYRATCHDSSTGESSGFCSRIIVNVA